MERGRGATEGGGEGAGGSTDMCTAISLRVKEDDPGSETTRWLATSIFMSADSLAGGAACFARWPPRAWVCAALARDTGTGTTGASLSACFGERLEGGEGFGDALGGETGVMPKCARL